MQGQVCVHDLHVGRVAPDRPYEPRAVDRLAREEPEVGQDAALVTGLQVAHAKLTRHLGNHVAGLDELANTHK